MSSAKKSSELSRARLGQLIETAIIEAEDPEIRDNKAAVAGKLRVNPDTLDNWIAGRSEPGVIAVWKISGLTAKPFSWFADMSDGPPGEGFAAITEDLQDQVSGLRDQLRRFERDLVRLRKLAVRAALSEAEAERATARRSTRKAG